jgi:hypothetical protein
MMMANANIPKNLVAIIEELRISAEVKVRRITDKSSVNER